MAIPDIIQFGDITFTPPTWDEDTYYYTGQTVEDTALYYTALNDHINSNPPSANWKTPAVNPTQLSVIFGSAPTVIGSHMGRLILASPYIVEALGADTQGRYLMRFFLGYPVDNNDYTEYDFYAGPYPGDPVAAEVRGGRTSRILWAKTRGNVIIMGTPSGLITATGGALGVTPTENIIGRPPTPGSYDIQPQDAGGALFYFQRGGKYLNVISFSEERGGIQTETTNIEADDLFGGPTDWTYQESPNPTLWVIQDGQLVSLSINKINRQIAFSYHETNGTVKSLAKFPGPNGEDKIWLLVERGSKTYLESMEQFENDDSVLTDVFSDASVIKSVTNGEVTGLDHLEGYTVVVAVDGGAHPTRVVANGTISIQGDVSEAVVGLGYQARMKTMRLEAGSYLGIGQGRFKRIIETTIRLFRTLGGEVGQDGRLEPLVMRTAEDPYGQAPEPYTGDKRLEESHSYSRDGYLVVEQNDPLPMTVVALIPVIETEDE